MPEKLTSEVSAPRPLPSIPDAIFFRIKTSLFQLQRTLKNYFVDQPHQYPKSNSLLEKPVLASLSTPLWTQGNQAEMQLTAGKIENLRIAVRRMNGVEVAAGEVFSFWKHIGRPTKGRGFVEGRELRQGCIIPTTGGGLCQLSNALYAVALEAGFEIVERHAHTQIIPGSLAERGLDATVFWNYVDLRFKAKKPFRIEAFLTGDSLVVRLRGDKNSLSVMQSACVENEASRTAAHNSCASCGELSCFRNIALPAKQTAFGKTAYLVDEYWQEFDDYIQNQRSEKDLLYIPIDGERFKKVNYAWKKTGFGDIKSATFATLRRALDSRKLARQGAARQQTLLNHDAVIAKRLAAQLPYDVTHLCVSQNLLPFLWRDGYLGGRTFDVLMTRLPMQVLQTRLDEARLLHPQSPTLGDFRADKILVEAEREALRQATRIITPHSDIASLYAEKAIVLDWQIPEVKTPHQPGHKILFPASTLGRKGAYELREVAKELGIELVVSGSELEGENFWQDVRVNKPQASRFDDIGLVVLPAFVEHQPRILLQAVARGIPVIASSACGLENVDAVINIPPGNKQALFAAIKAQINIGVLPHEYNQRKATIVSRQM
jgi:hypothetical protein